MWGPRVGAEAGAEPRGPRFPPLQIIKQKNQKKISEESPKYSAKFKQLCQK